MDPMDPTGLPPDDPMRKFLEGYGMKLIAEYKRRHHEFFVTFIQTHLYEHPEDNPALERFLRAWTEAVEVLNAEGVGK
jgi:hypothetical protein